jgi:hypothetical protein
MGSSLLFFPYLSSRLFLAADDLVTDRSRVHARQSRRGGSVRARTGSGRGCVPPAARQPAGHLVRSEACDTRSIAIEYNEVQQATLDGRHGPRPFRVLSRFAICFAIGRVAIVSQTRRKSWRHVEPGQGSLEGNLAKLGRSRDKPTTSRFAKDFNSRLR